MKNYQKDFDEQLLMASQTDVSDGELLSIAREYIETLQKKVEEVTGKKIEEV